MIVTMAFMISTVFRSSSLAIGLSIFIMFAGQIITLLLMRYSWGKYFLFANTDLTPVLRGAAAGRRDDAWFLYHRAGLLLLIV